MISIDTKQMRQIDDTAVKGYKISRLILMEHAGLEVAKAAVKMLNNYAGRKISIFCGTGYNGGDGMVAARHLCNWGYEVVLYLIGKESKCKGETLSNLNILRKLDVEVVNYKSGSIQALKKRLRHSGLIIDAILGIGLEGKLKTSVSGLIRCLNGLGLPILAVDVPSGLNPDTGRVSDVCIEAAKTVTFTAPKKGFFLRCGPDNVGDVILRDIGIPKRIIKINLKE